MAVPDRGSIRLGGQELVGLPAHRRARLGVARAFQIPQPFAHLSVYENVLAAASFGAGLRGDEAAASATQALQRMPPAKFGKKLTPHQVALLDRWIEEGAKWQKHW